MIITKTYKIEAGANLRNADLYGANLRGADLSGAYVFGAEGLESEAVQA